MARSLTYTLDWDGQTYVFDPDEDLTVGRLRALKRWSSRVGTYGAVLNGFNLRNAEALLAVGWVLRCKAGEKLADPNALPDFSSTLFDEAKLSDVVQCAACKGKGFLRVDGPDGDAPPTMTLDWDGKHYEWRQRDIMVSHLRQVGAWYPALDSLVAWRAAYLSGDPDGCACLLWVVRRLSSEPSIEPAAMDFPVGQFLDALGVLGAAECDGCGGRGWNLAEEKDPDPLDSPPTPGSSSDTSTETPTPSEPSTSAT